MPVVCGEGAAVFPLGVADFSAVDDLDPAAFEGGFAGAFVGSAVPPGDDADGFGLGSAVVDDVVVRECDVEGVELRGEGFWAVVGACGFVGVVVAAVVDLPAGVPGAGVVWGGVGGCGGFTDPEDGGGDVFFPGVADGFEGVCGCPGGADAGGGLRVPGGC